MDELEVFAQVGEDGFTRLVSAFYRGVINDNLLRPMYPDDDLPGAEKRLRDFLIYRFGGPQRYLQERGHPRLRARHFPFPIDQAARDRWIQLMNQALVETALPQESADALRGFFEAMATFLINRE